MIDHSRELSCIHDTKHRLAYVSPQSEDFLGYTPEEMMVK
ncbi:MAG: PAS domain-containing protein [Planctomycetota bacterium]|jgi:PAS domain-containing protein